jgi:hypothetical protein
MATQNKLTRRKFALIEDLFASETGEREILDKHKVGRRIYSRWLGDEQFCEQLNQLVVGAYRQSAFLIARNARSAAVTLVQLTNSENPETARKACLDILTMKLSTNLAPSSTAPDDKTKEPTPVSSQAASRLLADWAQESSVQQS